jgi:hypothetical protein
MTPEIVRELLLENGVAVPEEDVAALVEAFWRHAALVAPLLELNELSDYPAADPRP